MGVNLVHNGGVTLLGIALAAGARFIRVCMFTGAGVWDTGAWDEGCAADLMRRHPFATLVSTDDQGFPFVTHLPLHLEEREGRFVLWGHCAKPNPHWRHLQAWPQGLAMFMGPHAYQSPRIYPDAQRVPSWNYLAVHCKVRARLLEAPEAKEAVLKALRTNTAYLQREVAGRVRMKYAARLKFLADESFDEGSHIDKLLRSSHVAQDLGEE